MPLGPQLRPVLDSLLLDLDHANAQVGLLDGELAALARSERHAAAVTSRAKIEHEDEDEHDGREAGTAPHVVGG